MNGKKKYKETKNSRMERPGGLPSVEDPGPRRCVRCFLWLFPLVIAFFCNASVLDNGFVWDDYDISKHQITYLTSVQDIFFPARKVPDLGSFYFRPLVLASYKLDRALWDMDPKGYHLTVLISHCANVVLVYFLSLLLGSGTKFKYSMALMASALFAVFPVHAEVVAWNCGRNESLATNFVLLSLVLYAVFRKKGNMFALFGSCLCFLGGLLSKELAASMLFLIPLYDLCFCPNPYSPLTKAKENFSVYAFFGLTFLGYYALREMALGGFGLTALKSDLGVVRAVICSLGYYLKIACIPINLNYFISEIPSTNFFFVVSAFFVLITLFVAGRSFLGQGRIVAFCIFSFFFALLPSLSIAIMSISETPLALRYLYLPSVGFLVLLGYWLKIDDADFPRKVFPKNAVKMILFVAIFFFYQYMNLREIKIWQDDITLWRHVIKEAPETGLAYGELGRAYVVKGNYQEAIKYLQKSLEVKYDSEGRAISANTLGYSYTQFGKFDEAEAWYWKAIEFRPSDYALPYFNLGFIRLQKEALLPKGESDSELTERRKILEQAVVLFQKAIELNPHYYKARYHLGVCYVRMGRKDLAHQQLRYLVELDPSGEWASPAQEILRQIK